MRGKLAFNWPTAQMKAGRGVREIRLKAGYGARTIEGVRSTFEHGKQHPLVNTPP